MRENKGFTLIELLAVIVILAIIALIATPTILGVVEDPRRGAAESSILGFVDAVEKQGMINELDEATPDLTDGTYNITSTGIQSTESNSQNITVGLKGQRPDVSGSSSFEISGGEIKGTPVFKLGKYYVTYNSSTGKASASTTSPETTGD